MNCRSRNLKNVETFVFFLDAHIFHIPYILYLNSFATQSICTVDLRVYLQDIIHKMQKFYIMSNSKAVNQFGQIYKFRTMRKTLLCFNASFFPSANHFVKAFPHNFQG